MCTESHSDWKKQRGRKKYFLLLKCLNNWTKNLLYDITVHRDEHLQWRRNKLLPSPLSPLHTSSLPLFSFGFLFPSLPFSDVRVFYLHLKIKHVIGHLEFFPFPQCCSPVISADFIIVTDTSFIHRTLINCLSCIKQGAGEQRKKRKKKKKNHDCNQHPGCAPGGNKDIKRPICCTERLLRAMGGVVRGHLSHWRLRRRGRKHWGWLPGGGVNFCEAWRMRKRLLAGRVQGEFTRQETHTMTQR